MIISLNALPANVSMLFRIKLNEFKGENVHDITISDLKDYIYSTKWKNETDLELCDAVDDIMSIHSSDIFDYLKTKSIIEAKDLTLADFKDLINK